MGYLKRVKVDEIFGVSIFFLPLAEKFTAKFQGHDYEGTRLSDLKNDIKLNRCLELHIDVIYATGGSEMVKTNIIKISPHGSLTVGQHAGYGVSQNPEQKHLYPCTDANLAILKKSVSKRSRGFALIDEADTLANELTPFPKNFWKDKAKELLKKEGHE